LQTEGGTSLVELHHLLEPLSHEAQAAAAKNIEIIRSVVEKNNK